MRTCARPAWRDHFAGFQAPFVHIEDRPGVREECVRGGGRRRRPWRKQERRLEAGEVVAPGRPGAGAHRDRFQARARPGADDLDQRPGPVAQGGPDAGQRPVLVQHPVQRVERDHRVELVPEVHGEHVADGEAQPRRLERPGGRDHPRRGVDAEDRAVRQLVGDGGGDPAVAAADVEDPLVAGHGDAGQRLAGQPRLQRADLAVGQPVPVRHGLIVGYDARYG